MSKENMMTLLRKLSYKHSIWEVYTDFLEISAMAISNNVDMRNREAREQAYLRLINKYDELDTHRFPKLLGQLTLALNEKTTDVLGEIFMELNMGNHWKGQFFTPYTVCKAMAGMVFDKETLEQAIKKNGYVTINEPTCGGGATIIAAFEIIKELGYNPQKVMKVVCQDLDIRAVYMCYLQLSLLGIPAQVFHMNSLLMDVYDVFHTPFWIFNGFSNNTVTIDGKECKLDECKNGQLKLII